MCPAIAGNTALGAGSEIIALSIAAGLVKSILVMLITPLVAKYIGLDNPQSAVIYGGMMGTTSGVAAGIGAVDPRLVPYGAMPATFYTGLGCLAAPSLFFLIVFPLQVSLVKFQLSILNQLLLPLQLVISVHQHQDLTLSKWQE